MQEEKTLREEHDLMVMSVMTRPAWWEGRNSWRDSGRRRKLRSRKKMAMKVRTAAVVTWTMVRTWIPGVRYADGRGLGCVTGETGETGWDGLCAASWWRW